MKIGNVWVRRFARGLGLFAIGMAFSLATLSLATGPIVGNIVTLAGIVVSGWAAGFLVDKLFPGSM